MAHVIDGPDARAGILEFPCGVERLENGNTLIADAGDETSQGSEILEVDPRGQIVWRYGNGLVFAHSAKPMADGSLLVTDTTNDRVLAVSRDFRTVFDSNEWSEGSGKLSDGSHLRYPNDAHELEDGSLLITDRNNDRCIIATRDGRIVWKYDEGIRRPHNADPLSNGNILIVDSDGNRVIEVNREGRIVWSFGDNDGDETLNWPRDADRMPDGVSARAILSQHPAVFFACRT